MARLFKDLKVDEPDGKVYLTLYNRDGSAALRDVSVQVSSKIVQQGDNWTAAAANLLLEIGEDGHPQLALTPADIGAATAAQGVATYTHKKSGTVHTLTGTGDNIRFTATADFAAGDTVQVNGTACTAATAGGDALWDGFFKVGAVVVCYKNGSKLTFNGGGLLAKDLAKLTPENLKTGVEITANGKTVTGTFTADGTAVANQLSQDAVAYVKGQKVVGTLPECGQYQYCGSVGGGDGYVSFNDIPEGIYRKDGASWAPEIRAEQAAVASAVGLTPDKLKKGQTVLGINGSFVANACLGAAWGQDGLLDYSPDLFTGSGNTVTARYNMNIRLKTNAIVGYYHDRNGTAKICFLVNGAERCAASVTVDRQTKSAWNSESLSIGAGTTITLLKNTEVDWKGACGGGGSVFVESIW